MSKNEPVAPSARNQRVAGAVTPALLVAGRERLPRRAQYIARSTMIGTPLVERITADTSAPPRPGTSST